MLPKISIVTVSYNQAEFIEENILSVLEQNYPNIEHIIIDAGSTDGTLDILKKYSHLYWISEPDNGQSDGLNKGFRKATGEIIGWINSDDKLVPGSLEAVSNFFVENKNAIGVVGDLLKIAENGDTLFTRKSNEYTHNYLLNIAKGMTQQSIFFKKDVFNKIGYIDENIHYAMDRDFFIRVTTLGKLHYIPVTLAAFREQKNAKTSEGPHKFALELIKIRQKYNGDIFGPGNLTNIYTIATAPLRQVPWIKNLVNRMRQSKGNKDV